MNQSITLLYVYYMIRIFFNIVKYYPNNTFLPLQYFR
jgi:hypothetical protein